MSILYSPWTSQPQQDVGIDSSNPITSGLVDVIDMTGRPRSLILGTPATSFGTAPVQAVNKFGRVTDTNSGFGGWYFSRSDGKYTPASCSHVMVGQVNSFSAQYAGLFSTADGTGANSNSVFAYNGSANNANIGGTSGYVPVSGGLSGIQGSGPVVIVATFFAGRGNVWANGNKTVNNVNIGTISSYSTSRLVLFGERTASATYATKGSSALHLFYNRELSQAEALSLSQNPWQIFRPLPRRIFVPVATGGNVTITGNIGDATAAGLTASVSQAASIAAGVGNAVAAGSQASVSQQYTLSAGIGNATAAGLTATITASGLTTISCATGNAAAAGSQAIVNSAATVTCSVGNAAAAGLTAALDTAYTILANVGNATADGLSATIQAATGISCGVANAIAAGLTASITNNAPLTDSQKIDLILDILSNRQTLDPVTGVYTLYADDGTTVLKTAQAWEDAAGTIPYRGRALQRLDGMN